MGKDFLFWGLGLAALCCAPFWAYNRFVFSKKRVVIGSTPWGIERLGPWFPLLAALALAKAFLIEPVQVPSSSMRPTLSPGSMALSTKWDYARSSPAWLGAAAGWLEPSRGEVALFRYPGDPRSFFVKRVIGLPGDVIEIALDGSIKINGKALARERVSDCATPKERSARPVCSRAWRESWGDRSWVVWDNGETLAERSGRSSYCEKKASGELLCVTPKDCFFMVGDNRQDSFDSRDWGCAPRALLEGRARLEFSFSAWDSSGWIR